MHLIFKDEDAGTNKFWECKLEGDTVSLRWGGVGKTEDQLSKSFPSTESARKEYNRRVCEKLAKGYTPVADSVYALIEGVSSSDEPIAIGSEYIGEHVPNEVAIDICGWLTACIQHKMSSKQLANAWGRIEGDEIDALTAKWVELLGDTTALPRLYAKALEQGGDRFIPFDNSSYVDVVALRGDPGARAIECCVLTEANCRGNDGKWLYVWPDTLGPGTPIAFQTSDGVTLRKRPD